MPSNEPQFRFKANLQSGSGNAYLDLSGGGGYDPAVIANNNTETSNSNQIWEFYSVPGFETRVVIKNSSGKKQVLYAGSDGQNVQCSTSPNVWDAAAQWYLEGAEFGDVKNGTVVRFRNVKYANSYLDLSGGNTTNGNAFLVYPGHGGSNQSFKIVRR
ncbi:hypothetical protein NW762_008031 [Fusarium torreyae]|uniref:Ricin B lectin domain-containing protein n=1 Tax=Fusarium torreyae TaxID=1237075 RepID=A0A9W8VDX5_9HYPO|nr:hypothetical protein NW762_008031 [Fusarium torreyae]